MQNQYLGAWIKGFYRVSSYAIKASMNNEAVAQRLRVLKFWGKHGLQAAIDHSGKSRRTLYAWRKAYREQGLSGLTPQSKAPKNKRSRHWPRAVIGQIRALRKDFPNLGKEQLQILLKPWCQTKQLPCPSASTIGRLIADAPDKMRVSPKGKPKRFKRTKVSRHPKGYKAHRVGECVGMDAIERRMGTMKIYILTYIDEVSDYALAWH